MKCIKRNKWLQVAAWIIIGVASAPGHGAEWRLIKPTNSGIPGESVEFARFDPQGDLWVAARWPFFSEGGVAVRDHQTGIWETFANWDSPMPSQYVNDLEFGDGGVVWMATENGLVKKVGDQWTIYNMTNAPFVTNRVSEVELAPNGDLWIVNSTLGGVAAVFRFDGQVWEDFTVPDDIPFVFPLVRMSLQGLEVGADGHVWVGNMVLQGVAEYDGVSWTVHGQTLTDVFRHIQEDFEGNIWLVGQGNTLQKFDGKSFTAYYYANTPFLSTDVTAVVVGIDGAVYAANWFGQVIKTTNAGASWELFTSQNATLLSIAPAPDGDIWVTSLGAARHLNANGVWLEALNTFNTGLPDNFINDIMGDRQGNVWFSGGEGGFSKFGNQQWSNFGSHNPNAPWPVGADGTDSLFEDAAGNIWAGSNGVMRWEGDLMTHWDWSNSSLGVDAIVAIAQAGDGTMWIGAEYCGAFWFDGQDWVHHSFGGGTTNYVSDMTADVNGDLWVVAGVNVHHFDGETWEKFNTLNSPLSLGGLTSIAAHPDGSVWIGTGNGIMRFDGQSWTVYDQFNSPMPADEVQDVAIRSDGLVGLTTNEFGPNTPFPNGVVLFDGETWTVHTYQNSPMRHYQLGPVAFDKEGDLWISTISEGVAELDLLPPVVAGDGDGDGDVDLFDFSAFLDCVTGPGGGMFGNCGSFDFDGDQDVDFKDHGALQLAFAGSK